MAAVSVMGYGPRWVLSSADIGVTGSASGPAALLKGPRVAAKAAPAPAREELRPAARRHDAIPIPRKGGHGRPARIHVEAEGYPQPLLLFTEEGAAAGVTGTNIRRKAADSSRS
jgi:hypothetical protein